MTIPILKMLHIGQRIKEIFELQPKDHTIEWFADKLHCKRSNIYNIFNRSTIDTDLLFNISKILEHDFFRDMTMELYRNNLRKRNERQKIYEDLMYSIGQLLSRKLESVSFEQHHPYSYQLNKNDDNLSPMPPSEFIVSVKSDEQPESDPHIHVASVKENFEITYDLNENRKPGLIKVISYGNRPLNDPFSDIIHNLFKWFASSDNPDTGNIDNLTYATIAYNTLNYIN